MALGIPLATAAAAALFWSHAEAAHTIGELEQWPWRPVKIALTFGGVGAGWLCLGLQPFPKPALKWMLMPLYPFAMLAIAVAIDIWMNGIGIEGF